MVAAVSYFAHSFAAVAELFSPWDPLPSAHFALLHSLGIVSTVAYSTEYWKQLELRQLLASISLTPHIKYSNCCYYAVSVSPFQRLNSTVFESTTTWTTISTTPK